MRLSFTIFTLLLSYFALGQNVNWISVKSIQSAYGNPGHLLSIDTYGNAYSFSNFRSSIFNPNYTFNNNNPDSEDALITKNDALGVLQWAKHIKGPGSEIIWDMDADAVGNLYVLGTYTNGLNLDGQQLYGSGTYIAKFNTHGIKQWVKTATFSQPIQLELDDNGNIFFYVTSRTPFSYNGALFTKVNQYDNYYLAKLSNDGNLQWEKTYFGTDSPAVFGALTDLEIDHSGNVLLSGISNQSTINFDSLILANPYQGGFYLVKISASGQTQWGFVSGNNWGNSPSDIVIDSLNNIYLVGSYRGTVNFGADQLDLPQQSSCVISKYTANGQNLWAKSAIASGSSVAYSGDLDSLGNLVISGAFSGSVDFGNSVSLTSEANSSRQFVALYNNEGDIQWATASGAMTNGQQIQVKAYGQEMIYTAAFFLEQSVTYGSFTMVKSGADDYNIALGMLHHSASLDSRHIDNNNDITLYPNPIEGKLNIKSDKMVLRIDIIDAHGRIVKTGYGASEVDTEKLEAGLYFVSIETANGKEVRKIVKR